MESEITVQTCWETSWGWGGITLSSAAQGRAGERRRPEGLLYRHGAVDHRSARREEKENCLLLEGEDYQDGGDVCPFD